MMTISLCMIVRDEEDVIGRCLDSIASAVDEIIIVDTGSTDDTKKIALRYTDKVYDFKWIDDFSAARNYGYEKAEMEFQMWMDADDIITEEEKEKLLKLKSSLPEDVDMVTMKYHVHFDEYGNPTMTSMRERLTKTSKKYRFMDPVHECIPMQGKIYNSDIAIEHRKEKKDGVSWRNYNIYERMEKEGKVFTPRQLYYYARECKDHGLYEKAAKYYEEFLVTEKGWVEDNINACRGLSECCMQMKDEQRGLRALLKSLEYDSPRAETACAIAGYFRKKKNYKGAAQWYRIAMEIDPPESFCFISQDYHNYIPSIELSVCYYYLGDMGKAVYYNEKAGEYKPESQAVIYNRNFYDKITG